MRGAQDDPAGLLKALHAAFNATPQELKSAIGLMGSLQQQATDMMTGKTIGGVCVGPSFELQPTGEQRIPPEPATPSLSGHTITAMRSVTR